MKKKHTFVTLFCFIILSITFVYVIDFHKKKIILIKNYYPNGKLREKFEAYKKGGKLIRHGKYISWYDNGQKESEGKLFKGTAQGSWTEWNRDGSLYFQTNYKNGQINGLVTEWYDNGNKLSKTMFKNGFPNGPSIVWYENGNIKEICNYSYRFGLNGPYKKFYKNGEIAISGNYRKGKRVGKFIFYNKEGKRISEGEYNKLQNKGKNEPKQLKGVFKK